ncbi:MULTISPECIES: hypothetical protein [Microbacterium]|uniref:Uncharacterized protein n=1 Tax=Microbacterium oxydans TaxID=82380 RepID=A0A3S9WQ88_9MICO|nr:MULTISPECIES: hypothetical protein [Microbacterium]AZS42315.1 hypothetical protein CVS54_03678 [Microbacterium oxydans]
MDDKTPSPDQTPESTPDAPTVPVAPTPDAAAAPTAPAPPAGTAPAPGAGEHPTFPAAEPTPGATASSPKAGRKRALLIGGGIAAAVVLAGGGIAIGAAIGDEFDDDDRSSVSDGPRKDDSEDHGRPDDGPRSDDRGDTPSNGRGPVTGIGSASADELIAIADAARGAADGDVTSIDAKRDGTWEVQLSTAAGDETEVRVDKELAATVASTDAADGDDTGPTLILDDETIRALVAAALAEAEGMITDLDVDGDDVSPYDASVLTADSRSIDIEFDADFAVVGTDID